MAMAGLCGVMLQRFYDCLTHSGRDKMADIFKGIFLNENAGIVILTSLNFVSDGPVYNKPALDYVMARRRIGVNSSS